MPDVLISFYPCSDASLFQGALVAKLIDFGLARRHEGSGKMEYGMGRHNMACDSAAESLSEAEDGQCRAEGGGGDSKLDNTITQHAPECCEAPAPNPKNPSRFWSHKSDVWAFGTMVLWELMFCACSVNVDEMRRDNDIQRRMYNKPAKNTKEGQLAAWDTANANSEALRHRIATHLRERYDPSGVRSEDERRMFGTLCDVLQGMCEGNHDARASAASSLQRLEATGIKRQFSREVAPWHLSFLISKRASSLFAPGSDTALPAAKKSAPPASVSEFSTFSHLCKFMDSFCSSGHIRFTCEKISENDSRQVMH